MNKPLFSIVCISKNEANTIPKLTASLKDFIDREGELILLDTGSTDGTAEVARKLGWNVTEVGEKFITTIDAKLARKINERFIVDGEEPIVKDGSRLFDFASARNYATSLASNDMICSLDGDEAYTTFDIDELNRLIKEGVSQFEYQFVYAHDKWGKAAVQFVQSKFFDRRKISWRNIVHEVLQGDGRRLLLPETVIKLEHFQEPNKDHRSNYLPGLALDCFQNPNEDRQSHYFARECMWHGRPKSAIKEFKRHIEMDRWPAERAQSAIFTGDCYGILGKPEEQIYWYNKAFYMDPNRREALIKIAIFYSQNQNYKVCAAYTKAALEIPWTDYYANDVTHYEDYPHWLLYSSYGWMGKIEEARLHINKALEYQPLNPIYLRDLRYYYDLPTVSVIIPQLGREDGLKRVVASIKALNYPQDKIDIKIVEGEETVPIKVKKGVEETKGEYICYMANDTEMTPDSLILAIKESMDTGKSLIAFDTGVRNDEGFICEHFIIKRGLVSLLSGGNIFDLSFKHYCVDDWLWKQCDKRGQAMISKGKVNHYHFSRIGSGIEKDWVVEKALTSMESDREILKEKLKTL